jgi:peptidoglycan/LPS O-acetylase OafA/YrhL
MSSVGAARSGDQGKIEALDGLRAISILLVLFGHLNGTRGFARFSWPAGDVAHLGVVVFFVISGHLITHLLIEEEARHGSVSLKLFYARRSIRIFPAAFAYLGAMGLLSAFDAVRLTGADVLHSLTYTVNYFPGRSWEIGHLWSLSVEEQFYLLWPFAFSRATRNGRIAIALAVIVAGPFARGLAALFLRGSPYHDMEMFPMVADSLAAGCLLACSRKWLERQGWYLALFRPWVSLLLVMTVLITNRYLGLSSWISVPGIGLINLLVAVLVHRSVHMGRAGFGRVLNWRPLAFCGLLSYSLYLWQQPFLNRHSQSPMTAFPVNLAMAVCCALLSYTLLEKPLMGLRRRLRRT